jgi:hypothetical protein
MATAKTTEKPVTTEVAVPLGGAAALPASLLAELAAEAKDAAAKERPLVSKISARAGMLSYQGNPIPGNRLPCVVLFAGYRNVFYSVSYDPDNIKNPDCFALSVSGEDMAPHENVVKPCHTTCTGCENAKWGTAMRNGKPGRGKACKETRRVVVLPVSALESADAVKKAELAFLDVPVTSGRNYSGYVNRLSTSANLPIWAAVTDVSARPHVRNQFELIFEPTQAIQDEEVLLAIKSRLEEARAIIMTPYEGADDDADEAPPVKDSKKF